MQQNINSLNVNQIRIDGGTQSRASLDYDVVSKYSEDYESGAEFPPITVFYDGSEYWLADGFHRLAARKKNGMPTMACDVRQGSRLDAVRFSSGANNSHGLPRKPADYARAYQCAVDNKLCKPADAKQVAALLNCSDRWARELTKKTRETNKQDRDGEILRLHAKGKTQQEIAEIVGCGQKTVSRIIESKRNSSEMTKTTEQGAEQEQESEPASEDAMQRETETETETEGGNPEPEPEQAKPEPKPEPEKDNGSKKQSGTNGKYTPARFVYLQLGNTIKMFSPRDPDAIEWIEKLISDLSSIIEQFKSGAQK